MAARFLNQALSTMDRVFKFIGGDRGLSEIENALPIQRVVDVRRMAEIAASQVMTANGGYIQLVKVFTHAGLDTLQGIFTVNAALFGSLAPLSWPSDIDAWVIDTWIWSTLTTPVIGTSAVALFRTRPGSALVSGHLIGFWDTGVIVCDVAGTGDDSAAVKGSAKLDAQFPMMVNDKDVLSFRNTAGAAAGDVAMVVQLWVGPKGTLPPGMA